MQFQFHKKQKPTPCMYKGDCYNKHCKFFHTPEQEAERCAKIADRAIKKAEVAIGAAQYARAAMMQGHAYGQGRGQGQVQVQARGQVQGRVQDGSPVVFVVVQDGTPMNSFLNGTPMIGGRRTFPN